MYHLSAKPTTSATTAIYGNNILLSYYPILIIPLCVSFLVSLIV